MVIIQYYIRKWIKSNTTFEQFSQDQFKYLAIIG